MNIRTTVRYHYIKIKKTNHFNRWNESVVNNRNSHIMLVGEYRLGTTDLDKADIIC